MNNATLKKDHSTLAGELHISGSKSISNRVLIMAELSGKPIEEFDFENLSEADDTLRLQYYLELIRSCSLQRLPLVINAENAGTVMRFLSSFLTIKAGNWLLTGSSRMKNRPIEILADALRELGADITYTEKTGYPPLLIKGVELAGGTLELDASVSSQFISSLMMIAPVTGKGMHLRFSEKPVSFPYIVMTKKLMERFGVAVELDTHSVKVNPSRYRIKDMAIEPDWSSASYWYEAAALADEADILLRGFSEGSVQGDSRVQKIFEELGVQTTAEENGIRLTKSGKTTARFTYDFSDVPDLVPAVLTTCAALHIPADISGVDHLKHKESDRMQALGNELSKIGAQITEEKGTYHLRMKKKASGSKDLVFATYDDHRMAMSFAPLVLKYGQIVIENKDVVEKSYPAYWNDLEQLKIVHSIS